ncbi:hypothetical protein QR680_003515 [Steinernema hermaphroditum]|uniref:Uncharacterized protein n=1 Tax=Steinernema hermaphroditum TaxID=289476 RepID=A0AA39HLN4_9BILA|nr:hypothetical protein QR680_003515 [Steinernema hermaphroditum]
MKVLCILSALSLATIAISAPVPSEEPPVELSLASNSSYTSAPANLSTSETSTSSSTSLPAEGPSTTVPPSPSTTFSPCIAHTFPIQLSKKPSPAEKMAFLREISIISFMKKNLSDFITAEIRAGNGGTIYKALNVILHGDALFTDAEIFMNHQSELGNFLLKLTEYSREVMNFIRYVVKEYATVVEYKHVGEVAESMKRIEKKASELSDEAVQNMKYYIETAECDAQVNATE